MSKKILVCDDEEGVRESLKLILGDHFELILTGNPEQCLNVVENNGSVGLVFLDIKMPKMNGLEALKKIKELKPGLPVVIITGYKMVETASEAVNAGAAEYIVKPFKSDAILAATKKHFAAPTS